MVISCFGSAMAQGKGRKGFLDSLNLTRPFFTYLSSQRALFDVLRAFAGYDEEVGYCQGMANVAAMLLMYCEDEVTKRVMRG